MDFLLKVSRIKKWSILPGPIHQNNTLLSYVLLPKTDRTVCAWSFNLRRDKFVILEGRREVFYALTRCYFNWGTEGKVSPRGARRQVKHRGVNVFCLLILHVKKMTTRDDKLTSEIYCGTQCKSAYFAGRARKPFHFWSYRNFFLSALNKTILFQKYFTENVLKPLLKQAQYYLRDLHSKVRSLNVIHTFFLILERAKCVP